MRRKCLLLFVINFLFIHQLVYSADLYPLYTMGCKPAERPKQKVSKPDETASPPVKKQPAQSLPYKKEAKKKIKKGRPARLQQIGAFKNKKNAERLVKRLKKNGCTAIIRSGLLKDKKKIYRVLTKKTNACPINISSFKEDQKKKKAVQPVLAQKPDKSEEGETLSDEIKRDIGPEKESQEEHVVPQVSSAKSEEGSEVFSEVLPDEKTGTERLPEEKHKKEFSAKAPKDILSIVETETVSRTSSIEEKPIERGRITSDIFGRRGGYFHPFLSVAQYYTDNVFNRSDKKSEDFVTVISPGIWLTVPHIYEKLLTIDTWNISPGGFILSRPKTESFRRYQTYLFYNADIEKFSKYSSEDTSSHKIEGLLLYNFRGGLSAEFVGQYLASHDARGTGISTELDKFRTNLANLIITYDPTQRFRLRIDYSNFLLNYRASRNDFRDRTDNTVSAYLFYRFKPKTALFIEYEFFDIDYNKDILSNSKEHHYFGGLQWDITAKSKGSIKAGYGIKNFDKTLDEKNEFLLEAQIDHKFTPKTSLRIKILRRTNETNISTTDFIISDIVKIGYIQRFTGKITGNIDVLYINDKYKGNLTFGGETKERRDDFFRSSFTLEYEFKEWLKMDLGYIYSQRNSNFADFDYASNTTFIRVIGSL